MIRILLADDHKVLREGLAGLLSEEDDLEVVGEAEDGFAAVEMVRALQPDVVVMDESMPGMNGIQATRMICRDAAHPPVIGLSMFEEADMAKAFLAAGASAYLSKGGPSSSLTETIRCVAAGGPLAI